MANDNETVEQVSGEFKTSRHTCKNCDFEVCPSIIAFADRIIAAHNREVAAKYAEIEKLKKENASLRVIVSGATVADGNLREEIERLREIVKKLADELETMICNEIVKSSKRHGK